MRKEVIELLDILVCPDDRTKLKVGSNGLECPSCGLCFSSHDDVPILFGKRTQAMFESGFPETIDEKVAKANWNFHNTNANCYDEHHAGDILSFVSQERLRHNLARLRVNGKKPSRLLDLGCGTGNILRNADASLKVGIDISTNSIDRAKLFTPHVFVGDIASLPFADESFDVVTAFSVLHHVVDIEKLLMEVYRVLVPCGMFYSDWDPNRSSGALRRLRAQILAFPIVRKLKCSVKNIFPLPKEVLQDEAVAKAKYEYALANYHEDISSHKKFNPRVLRKLLRKIGFHDIGIYVFDHRPVDNIFRHHKSNWFNDLRYKRFMTFSKK